MGKPSIQRVDASMLKVPRFRCEFEGCKKYFNKLSRLKYHQNVHLEQKPYKCEYADCTSAYYRPNHLKRHVEKTHPSNLSTEEESFDFRCEHEGCKAAFDSETSLYYHNKRKHCSQQFQCTFCEKKFSKKWMFKEHESSHTNASPFQCTFESCKQEFKDYKEFKAHKRNHVKKEAVPVKYTCSECQETFTKWSDLVKHRQNQHPSGEGAITSCKTCGKLFTKRNLKRHEQVHQEDRISFQCPIENCPRFYLHQRNLSHHMRIKHDDQGFLCKICDRKLSSKQKLEHHIQVIHSGSISTKRKPKKKQKSDNLIKKLGTMTDSDWEVKTPGPSRYIRQKYNCIKFPDPAPSKDEVRDFVECKS